MGRFGVLHIVFGGMSYKMVKHFVQQMQYEFKMSLVG